ETLPSVEEPCLEEIGTQEGPGAVQHSARYRTPTAADKHDLCSRRRVSIDFMQHFFQVRERFMHQRMGKLANAAIHDQAFVHEVVAEMRAGTFEQSQHRVRPPARVPHESSAKG